MTETGRIVTKAGGLISTDHEIKQSVNPVFCDPWAIRPDWLNTLAQAPAAVAAKDGERSHDSPVVMRDGVAVIDIRGVITGMLHGGIRPGRPLIIWPNISRRRWKIGR